MDMAAPSQPQQAIYNAIVIRAGIQTSFTAYHLAMVKANVPVYGLPALEYLGKKMCHHHGSPTDPEEWDQVFPGAACPDVTLLSSFITSHLPGLEAQTAVVTCLYTNTPDGDFILDWHTKFSNIIIGAGFSGLGFKLAPVVGQLLCQLSPGEELSHSTSPCAITHFPGMLLAVPSQHCSGLQLSLHPQCPYTPV
ncbi:LOW QUALITY PROTEIN: peroxisomal sarcosine oxidase [Phaethornis superciliosus]